MYAYILYRQILCALNILGSIFVDWARFHASKQIPKMYLDVSYNSTVSEVLSQHGFCLSPVLLALVFIISCQERLNTIFIVRCTK
jgi:hypothetical protein